MLKSLKGEIMKKNWLDGKTVIITGASGGIGFALSKALIEKHDCKIIGIARNKEKIENAIESLGEKKSNFSYLLFDVSKFENWKILSDHLDKNGIIPDVLINNAGFMLPFKSFENCTIDEIDEIVATDIKSVLYGVKTIMPDIKKSDFPAIINVSSAAGLCAVAGESLYCASKFAVRGFTETLRAEYHKKIFVSGIYPGFIETDIVDRMNLNKDDEKTIKKMMMPLPKATDRIVKGLERKKYHICFGKDGKLMSVFSKLFPKSTPLIIATVLKNSGLKTFDEIK